MAPGLTVNSLLAREVVTVFERNQEIILAAGVGFIQHSTDWLLLLAALSVPQSVRPCPLLSSADIYFR